MVNRQIVTYHEAATTSSTGNNYGPLGIGSGFKLTRLRARGVVNFATVAFAVTDELEEPLLLALQYGAFDYTPLDLTVIANRESSQMLRIECPIAGGNTGYWAPSSDTAGQNGSVGIDLTWSGQMKLAAATDLYFTISHLYTTTVKWGFYGSVEAMYI